MGLVIFKRFNNVGEALVAFSALESAGFHPSWHTYHQAYVSILEMLALGGFIIELPAHEARDAITWLNKIKANPLPAAEPISFGRFGRWRTTIFTFMLTYLWVIPFLVLLPGLPIILHAKYIAHPKLERKSDEH